MGVSGVMEDAVPVVAGEDNDAAAPPTVRWSRDHGERIERWALGDAHALEGEDRSLIRTGPGMGGER
jgi:hypothetical protein